MGFDLYGKKAKSEKGEYFRNNIWYWHPLWRFVGETCSDILTEKDLTRGSYNDGHFINEQKTAELATRLFEILDELKEPRLKQALAKDEDVPAERKQEQMWRDVFSQMFEGISQHEDGNTRKETKDNIRAFAEFCRDSGGFEIC